MVNEKRLVAEFLELVQIDSVSGQERKIADVLKEKLKTLELKVREDNAGSVVRAKVGCEATAGNIIGVLEGETGVPAIMFCAHMDTVEPGRMVKPRMEGDTIYSAGDTILGADDKAGVAAIIEALRIVKENGLEHGNIEVVFTIMEESGLLGAKNLDRKLLKAEMGFVLDSEGDPGSIIVRAPSQDKIKAVVKGRSAHAGINPEDGVNAIQVAARAVSEMRLGRIDDETTANIGIISGGRAINIVPDRVELKGEARSLDDDKREAQTRHMTEALRKAAQRFGAKVDLDVELLYPRMNLEESSPVVKAAVQASRAAGLNPKLGQTGGGSDANIFNGYGIPTVNIGVGMKKVHTTEEYIKITDLATSARYVLEIIRGARELK